MTKPTTTKGTQASPTEQEKLGNPWPLRLTKAQKNQVDEFSRRTGIPRANALRAMIAWVAPRALKNEINLFECAQS